MIPKATVDQILDTAKIEDVIGEFVNLRRRGINMLGLCPFHDEKTPSFIVSPTKGIYKCFGCGRAGNVSKFIMEHESVGYAEALKYLANKYNIEVVEREISPEERQAQQLSESLYILNDFAAKYFQNQLFFTDEGKSVGLSYFKERGFLESTIKKWDLGYMGQPNPGFLHTATKEGFSEEVLDKSGLITRAGGDFFRNRVMFGLHNLSGKVIGFAGRTLSSDKKQPKYINSPETEVYEKRKTLYGLHLAKTAIRKEDNCYLVEGYTDVITLSQGGIENVVASSGTALTVEQIRLIRRFTQNISVIYDGDKAGIMAALRGLDLILEEDMNVRLVLLPDGEDPDSYFKKAGSEGFRAYVSEKAKDFILFKTDLLLNDAGKDPIKRSKVAADIVQSISRVPNAVSRSNYITVCSEILHINEEVLAGEVKREVGALKQERYRNKQRELARQAQEDFENQTIIRSEEEADPRPPVQQRASFAPTYKDEYQERDLVRILISGGDKFYDKKQGITIAQYILHNIGDSLEEFENPVYRRIFELAMAISNQGQELGPNLFINHEDEAIQKVAIDVSTFPYSYSDWESKGVYLQTQPSPEANFARDSLQAILRFRLRKAQNLIDDVSKTLHEEELSDDEKVLNIKILQQLQNEKAQIMSALKQTVL